MPNDDLTAWLGPAADSMTPERLERVTELSRRIYAFYPDPGEYEEREAALSAVVQHLLGEITPEEARRTLTDAVRAAARARAASTWLGVAIVAERMAAGERPVKAVVARECGVERMAFLEALGERARRRRNSR